MRASQRASKVILRKNDTFAAAVSIPADQAWFWAPEWQARIAEAEADRVVGNSTVYASDADFLAALDSD